MCSFRVILSILQILQILQNTETNNIYRKIL